MNVTFKGNQMHLAGKTLQTGDKLPAFSLRDGGLNPVGPEDLSGPMILLTVPSLDTGVCDMEVRKFNERAAESGKVKIYAVSMDLPFAQARWCGGAGITQVTALSDYFDKSFGKATGTLIEELGLLTRAVFLVDGDKTVRYAEIVPEVTDHPDYDAVFQNLSEIK